MDKLFEKLLNMKDLNKNESDLLVKQIFEGGIDAIKLSSILTLLFKKNESFEEIFSFAKYLKSKSLKINIKGKLMDTCGTGGDNKNSFNFSTATSILLSTFDIKIVKHGNRSVTSKSGSFDVLESLGINVNLDSKSTHNFFKKNGICFLFAPKFHSSLKNVSEIRKSLPFRTIFNLLGPLLNPAKLTFQIIGVSEEKNLITHAKCLKKFGIKNAWVVFCKKGYDELTTISDNIIVEIKNNKISKKKIINPKSLGFKLRKEEELKGGTPEENAFIMKRVFEGESGAIRDNIILNTAACLVICEKSQSLKSAINLASRNIDNGLAHQKLNSLINYKT
ncbi:MAG: anthranilate phosphoribosyltransferase [Alphaproteobacteria bacterium]